MDDKHPQITIRDLGPKKRSVYMTCAYKGCTQTAMDPWPQRQDPGSPEWIPSLDSMIRTLGMCERDGSIYCCRQCADVDRYVHAQGRVTPVTAVQDASYQRTKGERALLQAHSIQAAKAAQVQADKRKGAPR